MSWRWLLVLVLILGSFWLGNLTLFNWWAAGGPSTPHPEAYAFRGNLFFVIACLFFVAFVIVVVMNIKSQRKRGQPRT